MYVTGFRAVRFDDLASPGECVLIQPLSSPFTFHVSFQYVYKPHVSDSLFPSMSGIAYFLIPTTNYL